MASLDTKTEKKGKNTRACDIESVPQTGKELHLAVGIFDGVHLGHRAVAGAAVQSARRAGGIPAVLTFQPHPSRILTPEQPTLLLMPPALKARLLREMGMELIINQPFTENFAALPAEEFVPHLKKHLLKLSALYVGENYHFGRGRRGEISMLIRQAGRHGLDVYSAERIRRNGLPINSSRIRQALAAGNLDEANALLGRHYFSEGAVLRGSQRGRGMGFPTLNFNWLPESRPRYGVYAVMVAPAEKENPERAPVPGAASYGVRPTVTNDTEPTLEVHLLEPAEWAEGDMLRVEWRHFIRPEEKFLSVEHLKKQIAEDVKKARAALSV